jgi:hypothetical protein
LTHYFRGKGVRSDHGDHDRVDDRRIAWRRWRGLHEQRESDEMGGDHHSSLLALRRMGLLHRANIEPELMMMRPAEGVWLSPGGAAASPAPR